MALPALHTGSVGLVASSLMAGAATPGIVPLALGRTHEVLRRHQAAQKRAWIAATTSFAVMQATGAYALSFLFVRSGGDYRLLFGMGAAALVLALVADLLVPSGAEQEDTA